MWSQDKPSISNLKINFFLYFNYFKFEKIPRLSACDPINFIYFKFGRDI